MVYSMHMYNIFIIQIVVYEACYKEDVLIIHGYVLLDSKDSAEMVNLF